MTEIRIKDIEMLNNTEQDIIRQKKIIQELPEVKELDRLQQYKSILENKIESYSLYNSLEIGEIIAKLMSKFEGIDYYFTERNGFDLLSGNFDYNIESNLKYGDIHPYYHYTITNYKKKNFFGMMKKMMMKKSVIYYHLVIQQNLHCNPIIKIEI